MTNLVQQQHRQQEAACKSLLRQRLVRFQDEIQSHRNHTNTNKNDENGCCGPDDSFSTCSTTSTSRSHQDDDSSLWDMLEYEPCNNMGRNPWEQPSCTPDYYYDDEDIKSAVWGTRSEWEQSKADLKRDQRICRLWGRRFSNNKSFTTLGIKDTFGAGLRAKEEAREAAAKIVVPSSAKTKSGQHVPQQRINDFEQLAARYAQATKESTSRAHEDAVQLAKEIQNSQCEI